jgi:hypothetical protein
MKEAAIAGMTEEQKEVMRHRSVASAKNPF